MCCCFCCKSIKWVIVTFYSLKWFSNSSYLKKRMFFSFQDPTSTFRMTTIFRLIYCQIHKYFFFLPTITPRQIIAFFRLLERVLSPRWVWKPQTKSNNFLFFFLKITIFVTSLICVTYHFHLLSGRFRMANEKQDPIDVPALHRLGSAASVRIQQAVRVHKGIHRRRRTNEDTARKRVTRAGIEWGSSATALDMLLFNNPPFVP